MPPQLTYTKLDGLVDNLKVEAPCCAHPLIFWDVMSLLVQEDALRQSGSRGL